VNIDRAKAALREKEMWQKSMASNSWTQSHSKLYWHLSSPAIRDGTGRSHVRLSGTEDKFTSGIATA
jgi:hypothetical protein